MSAELLIKWCAFLVLLLALWGMSNYLVKKRIGQNQYLQQIAFLPLSHGHSLHLVQTGKHKLVLIATSPQRSDLILNLNQEELEPIIQSEDTPNFKETGMIDRLIEDLIRRSKGGKV
ncbi:MAG: flagellar biosynthetic protein FliO [Candidatus Caenarcaniphilales bacterium]|nr:flagellar biosynthetic protein FliO [Candidatus Caenarcaniphilales bacterium]